MVLAEELRADTRETMAYLQGEGIELRVISGDAPATVAAIAADAGIPMHGAPVDGRDLPESDAELRRAGAARRPSWGASRPTASARYVEALRGRRRATS